MRLSAARLELEEAEAQKYAEAIRTYDDTKETWGFWRDLNKDIAHRMSWTGTCCQTANCV